MSESPSIDLSDLADSLTEQLSGYTGLQDAAMLVKDQDAIIRLHLRGYLTDCARDRAERRLIAACRAAVVKHRKSLAVPS